MAVVPLTDTGPSEPLQALDFSLTGKYVGNMFVPCSHEAQRKMTSTPSQRLEGALAFKDEGGF